MAYATKCLSNTINAIIMVLGLGLAIASIWLFVEVNYITSLRNSNHYMLDYRVYWPQAIPWMFFVVGMLAVVVTCCGFTGVKKRNSSIISVYTIFLGIIIMLLLAAGIIATVFAFSHATDEFVKDTIWDVFFQSKTDNDVASAFGNMEKRFHCCGSDGPRDYKNWKNEFPMSCCDTYYHGWIGSYTIDCDFTNKLANERYGCSTVAAHYAKITICVLAGISIFIAIIGIVNMFTSISMSRSLNKKPRMPPSEADSKKVLL